MPDKALDPMGIMEHAAELSRAGESFALATVVWRQPPSSGQHGSRAIVTADGQLHGWIGGACAEPVVIREAKRVLAEGTASLLWLGQDADLEGVHVPDGVLTIPISCQSDGALQVYIEPVLAAPHVLVVGRSPMAVTLLDLVRDIGWRGEIVDASAFDPASVTASTAGALRPVRRPALPVLEPAEVIDLVCGMTVQAVPANRPYDYHGTTYYFCAMGCRVAFEKDPESFIQQEASC